MSLVANSKPPQLPQQPEAHEQPAVGVLLQASSAAAPDPAGPDPAQRQSASVKFIDARIEKLLAGAPSAARAAAKAFASFLYQELPQPQGDVAADKVQRKAHLKANATIACDLAADVTKWLHPDSVTAMQDELEKLRLEAQRGGTTQAGVLAGMSDERAKSEFGLLLAAIGCLQEEMDGCVAEQRHGLAAGVTPAHVPEAEEKASADGDAPVASNKTSRTVAARQALGAVAQASEELASDAAEALRRAGRALSSAGGLGGRLAFSILAGMARAGGQIGAGLI
jgi:hypothetical protein